jgi:integrase
MNTWPKAVREYLALRRGLGFKLMQPGLDLADFARFLSRQAAAHVTVSLALKWAHRSPRSAQRLGNVRGFARYYRAIDPRTEIPPAGLLPFRPRRAQPYLYTDSETRGLLAAALRLSSFDPLRRWTFHALYGLLAVSGLRVGEALALHLDDVDLQAGVLTVRGAKFGQSRLVPLHASTKQVLLDYRARRHQSFVGRDVSDSFFVSKVGTRLSGSVVRTTFYQLSRQTGLRGPSDSHGPRLHDFRHRFAVETLIRWYRCGVDPDRRIQVLSTYLGHIHVADTYWYLSACPALMASAMRRVEERWSGLS